MRPWFAAVIALAVAPVWGADKLTLEDRVELPRQERGAVVVEEIQGDVAPNQGGGASSP